MLLADKILNHEELTEYELRQIAYEDWEIEEPIEFVEEIEGDDHRWDREIKTIISVRGILYALDWRRALTEMQENGFYNQPYQVEKRTKIVEIAEYIKV